MSIFSDHTFMAQALQLAERGLYTTHPNPRVGCVIVANDQVVGTGWHRRAGEPHAEVHALQAAGEQARGATAYVTLEPCSHFGRTPPCADALIAAGVQRVVMAMLDPNPVVAGRGRERLQAAGIEVVCGVLEAEARALNPGFIKRMEQGLPWVRVKLAMSLDGRTAMACGESQWITGSAARGEVQRLRARSSLVLTGADTLLLDKARLTVRETELGLADPELVAAILARPPLRLLIDSQHRVPLDAPFFQVGPAWVASIPDQSSAPDYGKVGHQLLTVPANATGQVDLYRLLKVLAERGINEVMVEAGARLAGAFAQLGLVDEYWIFVAPKLLGSAARPLLDWPLSHMSQAPSLDIRSVRAVGEDWCFQAVPKSK